MLVKRAIGKLNVELTDVIDPSVEQKLGEGLVTHGFAAGIEAQRQDLCITLRRGRQLIGGLTGNTHGAWLYIARLWVAPAHRREGLGSALIRAAEEEGIRRGCLASFLHTFDYEAPRFYERLDYHIVATLQHPRIAHERYYMLKHLAS